MRRSGSPTLPRRCPGRKSSSIRRAPRAAWRGGTGGTDTGGAGQWLRPERGLEYRPEMAPRLDPPAPPRARRSLSMTAAFCLLLFAIAAALSACGDAGADAEAIRSLVTREVAAINGKDLRTLSEIWSQDKTILLFDVPPPGRFQGGDQIGRLWKDFFDRVTDIHLTVYAVQAEAQGSLGYATYDS